MTDLYPQATHDLVRARHDLAPAAAAAFNEFSKAVFAKGALTTKVKQLIAVAVAHTTQCPYCIRGHTRAALRAGAGDEEIMESIWVASEMRAGGAFAHSLIAIDEMNSAGIAPRPDQASRRIENGERVGH